MAHRDSLGEGAKARRANLKSVGEFVSADVKEFNRGTLNSGSGRRVKSKKQALAIGYSEGRRALRK